MLGHAIRCTIRPDVFQKVSEQFPDLPQDCVFGTGPVRAHLLFSWTMDAAQTRVMGHFDLLIPTKDAVFALEFLDDVPQSGIS